MAKSLPYLRKESFLSPTSFFGSAWPNSSPFGSNPGLHPSAVWLLSSSPETVLSEVTCDPRLPDPADTFPLSDLSAAFAAIDPLLEILSFPDFPGPALLLFLPGQAAPSHSSSCSHSLNSAVSLVCPAGLPLLVASPHTWGLGRADLLPDSWPSLLGHCTGSSRSRSWQLLLSPQTQLLSLVPGSERNPRLPAEPAGN